MAFCDGTTGWVDEGRAVDVVFLNFIKAFGTVSHNILLGELRKRVLDEQSEVIGHWLDSRAQRAVSRC